MKKGFLIFMGLTGIASAGTPVWTFTPLTATSISVPIERQLTLPVSDNYDCRF
jgi:hypothetical protein